MKRIFGFMASVALVTAGIAGAQTIPSQVVVSQYSQWRVPGATALAAGTNTAIPFGPCIVSAANTNIAAFTAEVPVKIVDPNNPSIDEVVTPSAVVLSPGNCTVTLTTVNAHYPPYYIISGTAGLQEAVNANALTGAQNTAILDRYFYAGGGTAAMIAGATASPTLSLVDVTQAPYVTYQAIAGVYTAHGNTGGALPTAGNGTASGSGGAATNTVGNGNSFLVTVVIGTSPTTGGLFTELWPASASFSYLPNLTVRSVGSTPSPAFTYAVTGSSTHMLTVTVSAVPVTAATYVYQVSAQ